MATTGARRRPQKYPDELRERAVRMVLEIRRETGEKHGRTTRVARELGVGVSARSRYGTGSARPRSTPGVSLGCRPSMRSG